MKKILQKPQVKNLILGILVIIIGALCSSLGSWDNIDKTFCIKAGIAILLTIIYGILLVLYSTWEINERSIRGIFENRVKVYEEIMSGIDNICKETSNEVNSLIHNIIEEGKIDIKIWNFDKACMSVCKHIYNLLCHLNDNSKDFGVAYIRLEENAKPEIEIRMNAFANKNMQKPSIYNKKRRIDEDIDTNYHDVDLFRLGKSDMDILIGEDNINNVFSYTRKGSREENRGKYNQYIAIPVFCNDTKMIGLLEIVCLNNTQLGSSKNEIEELASKYIVPYSYLMLLLHKLEKALTAQPL